MMTYKRLNENLRITDTVVALVKAVFKMLQFFSKILVGREGSPAFS